MINSKFYLFLFLCLGCSVMSLCNPMDYCCSVPGVFQARMLEWVAISPSRGFSQPRDWTHASHVFCIAGGFFICWAIGETQYLFISLLLLLLSHFSHVQLCVTPCTVAHQASPSLGFSRQEHWSGLPFPSPMHESGKWKWSRSVVSDS